MKTNLILVGMIFLTIACKKKEEFELTTVEIRSTEYFTGDSCGNVGFQILELYSTNSYGIIDSTNVYGNFNGSYQHPNGRQPFELRLTSDLYLVGYSLPITTGSHNVLELEVTDLSTFTLNLNCSGPGQIEDVIRYRLDPIESDSPIYFAPEGQERACESTCGTYQPTQNVFSGEWIIKYQYKPTTSAAWTSLSDTINIQPGQDYIHTIVY